MLKKRISLLLLTILLTAIYTSAHAQANMTWEVWDSLPPNPELEKPEISDDQPGMAGAYSGISNGTLIVAGGANFPYGTPWKGGEKIWWKNIYALEIQEDGTRKWINSGHSLPIAMGYGISVTEGNRLLCIGGENKNGTVSKVISLKWDPLTKEIKSESLGPLPENFRAVSGDVCRGTVLVHGIRNGKNALLRLAPDGTWQDLPGCPGPPRTFPVGRTQSNGVVEGFFLFSGRTEDADDTTRLLHDGYMYDPIQNQWLALGEILVDGRPPLCIMGASSAKLGAGHILVFGGDNGEEFLQRAQLNAKRGEVIDSTDRARLKEELDDLFEHHRGFSQEILSYHTVTNTWSVLDTFPSALPVTTNVVPWQDGSYRVTSGEIHPGIRTKNIWKGQVNGHSNTFGWLNYTVIALYFLVMILIGVKYSRRQKSTDDYFKGGGRIPWWAAGLSLFGTSLSAITFMAVPAKTYTENWAYFFFQMTPLLTAPIIVYLFIPFFRRLNVTTAYEYLEKRFNLMTRLLGSLSFMLLQLGRVGIILLLPAIAINLVTGIDIKLCILAMGIISVIYTMMGGIEAVIWTDVLQVVVLLGGAVLCLVMISLQLDHGLAREAGIAADHEKLKILDWALDFRSPTIWVVVLGGIFANLIASGSDQTMVQRYLTTANVKEASQSAWTFALMAIPATLIFFSIGTLLFLYYRENPESLNPSLPNNDAIFPWYIVTELPAGISGLLIAGVLSAAMSSLSSSMNSVATAFTTDFYDRFGKKNTGSQLVPARIATLVFGILGIAFALLMASWNIKSLWDQFQLYIGWFAGGLGGLFLLGITTRKANGIGALTGLLLSAIIQYVLTSYTAMHPLLFAMTGFVSCYVFSYISSLIFPAGQKDITGLTIYTVTGAKRKNRDK